MKRTALDKIVEWYEREDRKPLVIWGARQVGKTYLLKNLFLEQYCTDHVYIDLKRDDETCNYFQTTVDPTKYLNYIEARWNKRIRKECPLIIDEIQTCPNVLTSLKYFCQDYPELPVIVTGSLVRTALQPEGDADVLYPVGKIESLNLYPLNFEEFLLNTNERLLELIKEAYHSRSPLDQGAHQLALQALYKYLSIGGMPESLNKYIETGSYVEAERIIEEVYDNYVADMASYVRSSEQILKNRKIYQNVFSQLNKENKNFKISQIEKGRSNRDYFNAYEWLTLSRVVYRSENKTGKVTVPFIMNENNLFRLYLADESMFVYQSRIRRSDFLTHDTRNTLSGIFYENYVADELVAKGVPLYYWTGKNENEIEFLVENSGTVIPIEVKKKRGKFNSLKAFRNQNPKALAIKISADNYGYDEEQELLTLPLYQAFLLAEDVANNALIR